MNHYDAIVVGGGVAGLTSAAFLIKYGYHTLLVEKEATLGGLVGTFNDQGFSFDKGIRAIENSGIVLPMLKSLGIDIDFLPNPVAIGFKDEWVKITSKASLSAYCKVLAHHFPTEVEAIEKIAGEIVRVMDYMDVIYGIDNPLFLDIQDIKYIFNTLLPWLAKYNKSMKKVKEFNGDVNTYLKQFTSNQALIDMITQHFFKATPAFFALSYFGFYADYMYPAGGTGAIVEALTNYITSNGGAILTKTKIQSIDSVLHIITDTKDETFHYRKLVWAANQKSLYSQLLLAPKNSLKQKEMVMSAHGSDSILTCFLGLDVAGSFFDKMPGVHAFYTPATVGLSSLPSWRDAPNLTKWVEAYLANTTYEISVPSLRDPSLAPMGHSSLIVSTLFDYELAKQFKDPKKYDDFKAWCLNQIIKTLDEGAFKGLAEHVVYKSCSTPLTIEARTGNAEGAITGWSFLNKTIPSEHRFKKIRNSIYTPIQDVLQCGQWTFSPAGFPVSILTGKLTADFIRKRLKK